MAAPLACGSMFGEHDAFRSRSRQDLFADLGCGMRGLVAASFFAMLIQGCDRPEPGESRGSTTPRYERASPDLALEQSVRPVRIGELGPNFAACNTVATTRDRAAGAEATLMVRTAPFEAAP